MSDSSGSRRPVTPARSSPATAPIPPDQPGWRKSRCPSTCTSPWRARRRSASIAPSRMLQSPPSTSGRSPASSSVADPVGEGPRVADERGAVDRHRRRTPARRPARRRAASEPLDEAAGAQRVRQAPHARFEARLRRAQPEVARGVEDREAVMRRGRGRRDGRWTTITGMSDSCMTWLETEPSTAARDPPAAARAHHDHVVLALARRAQRARAPGRRRAGAWSARGRRAPGRRPRAGAVSSSSCSASCTPFIPPGACQDSSGGGGTTVTSARRARDACAIATAWASASSASGEPS